MALPPKRKHQKMGVRQPVQRRWPQHERFVKTHACAVRGCNSDRIEFAHWRTAANAGTSTKPFDWFGISLCIEHHKFAHDHGHKTFERTFGVNWLKLASDYAKQSTDTGMKAAMREPGAVLFPEDDPELREVA